MANIKTYVDGTAYDTVGSSDGKYFTSTFGDGIVIDKGGNIQASIKGDISGGSGRTIDFDLYKTTDLNISGETYGYGITLRMEPMIRARTIPPFTQPPILGTTLLKLQFHSGTLTVEKASSIAAKNIAVNVSDQPLGGFTVEAKGEPISSPVWSSD